MNVVTVYKRSAWNSEKRVRLSMILTRFYNPEKWLHKFCTNQSRGSDRSNPGHIWIKPLSSELICDSHYHNMD